MAISRHTQKDIGNYEAKLIGPFTTRQIIFLAIGLVPTFLVDYVLYTLGVDTYTIFGITLVIMIVPCFFAFGSKLTYDMKPEDFLKDYYTYHILAPRIRKYQTETLDDVLDKESKKNQMQIQAQESDDNKKKKTTEKKPKLFGKMIIYPHKPDTEFQDFA